jgi:hypothetical protein
MKWRSASPGNIQIYQQMVSEFKRAYQAANQPEGMAMFEATDSYGNILAVYLTPEAVSHCDSLFDMFMPWNEVKGIPSPQSLSWIGGDERLR